MHSSTRRTIIRFIAVIIIAVSIEALLMIFKFALNGGGEYIIAAALLLVSLGVYVYLGGKAEVMLLKNNVNTRNRLDKGGGWLFNNRNKSVTKAGYNINQH